MFPVDEETDIKERFYTFFRDYTDQEGNRIYFQKIDRMILEEKVSIELNYEHLVIYDPQTASELLVDPENVLLKAQEAMEQLVYSSDAEYMDELGEGQLKIRLENIPDEIPIRKIRAEHLGKLWAAEGIVVRATEVKPLLLEGAFLCPECNQISFIQQEGGRYTPPQTCLNDMCRNTKVTSFRLLFSRSRLIDWQIVSLQERPEELPPGASPRSISCRLLGDLVDTVRPGDRVVVVGLLRTSSTSGMKPGKRATFDVWFDANNISSTVEEYENIEITEADLKKILELANDPWVHEKIIRSVAPGIHGLEHIKEAVMLMLVGGSDKTISGGMKLRGISHVLLIGDPGLGKSQILRYAQSISPRGIYTSGKGSSAAGLTASVLRDSETGEFTLEAGAIVLADKGLACIDEFDKMRNEDRSSIHEMMEQNTVSIAKAGIVATLNARTSILAAANPKMGRYEAKRTASENINLEPTILSRFDLIFVMADVPDPDIDRERAQHILSLHRGGLTADKLPPIDTDFLRKYIAYAKEHSHPVLSEDASRRIEEYYLEMREMSTGGAAIAITARQLEALVRLTEARARVAIREEATVEDAEAAIKLFRRSLEEVGIDPETGEFDIDILTTGTSKSKRSKIETVIDAIEELSGNTKKAVTITQIIKKCEGSGLTEDYVKEMVDELIHRGQLYQPELGKVKLP